MNDVFGNKLEIGDTVAFYAPNYRRMITGKVTAFTPQQIRVEYYNTWTYSTPGGVLFTYMQYPHNFAKKMS